MYLNHMDLIFSILFYDLSLNHYGLILISFRHFLGQLHQRFLETLVRFLVEWFAEDSKDNELSAVLKDILETPVSPELLPPKDGNIAQKTEDLVGPYELHDFFLYYLLRFGFSPAKILYLADNAELPYTHDFKLKWLRIFYRRFFSQQFKRSCMPDGAKVGTVNLSPRGDWRMPSDASSAVWLEEIDRLK